MRWTVQLPTWIWADMGGPPSSCYAQLCPEIGGDHVAVRADSGGRAGGQRLAEIEHGDVVADVENQVGMMLDQQHAGAGPRNRLDQRAEPLDLVDRQAGCRLV